MLSQRFRVTARGRERRAQRGEQRALAVLTFPKALLRPRRHGPRQFAIPPAVKPPLRPVLSFRLPQVLVQPRVHELHEHERRVRFGVETHDGPKLPDALVQVLERTLEGSALAADVLDVVTLVDDHRRVAELDPERVSDPRVEHVVVRAEYQLGGLQKVLHGEEFARPVRLRRLRHIL